MKARVENRDLRDSGQQVPSALDRPQRRRVVDRIDRLQGEDCRADAGIDDRRLAELHAAVHDTVHDGRDRLGPDVLERSDRGHGLVVVDAVQLERCRARVDDEERRHPRPGQVQLRITGSSSPCSRV